MVRAIFYTHQTSGMCTCNRTHQMKKTVLDGKSSQEYPVNAGVPLGSFFDPTLFRYTLTTFLMMLSVILLSMLMILCFILSVTRHLICGNNLNWLLNLNLIYETLWTGVRSGLLISMLGKLSWFCLTGLIIMVLLMWKLMGLFLRKGHLLRCLRLIFSSKLDCGSYIIPIAKTASKKIGASIFLWSFFLLRLLCISVNLPYALVWNTVVTFGLVSLVATLNC